MLEQAVRGPLLIPTEGGEVRFHPDGMLAADQNGILRHAGAWQEVETVQFEAPVRQSDGVMLPPLLDLHTHVSQHSMRGRFIEGITGNGAEGKLLAGLARNVFPAEESCSHPGIAEKIVRAFLADALSHGVVGGAAYMTSSALATEIALSILPAAWSVGLVLMNQNCPQALRTDEHRLEDDIERLAGRFGRRLIVTDRFAVVTDSPLRKRAAALAKKFGLRTQTHLNEQVAEKAHIEKHLYPHHSSYAEVYRAQGLLDHSCLVAHCVQMTGAEWRILRNSGSAIAHCPTSNLLLGSGLMRLNDLAENQIPYALATDMGASPTVSMLAEMQRFLQVHAGQSDRATAVEALFRSTRVPAELLGLEAQFGRLEAGSPMSFIEVHSNSLPLNATADDAIRSLLPDDPDSPPASVQRVTIAGRTVFSKDHPSATGAK